MGKGKQSKYPGVWKGNERWNAWITINGEDKLLGTFKLEEHAAIAYLLAKSEIKLKEEQ